MGPVLSIAAMAVSKLEARRQPCQRETLVWVLMKVKEGEAAAEFVINECCTTRGGREAAGGQIRGRGGLAVKEGSAEAERALRKLLHISIIHFGSGIADETLISIHYGVCCLSDEGDKYT